MAVDELEADAVDVGELLPVNELDDDRELDAEGVVDADTDTVGLAVGVSVEVAEFVVDGLSIMLPLGVCDAVDVAL